MTEFEELYILLVTYHPVFGATKIRRKGVTYYLYLEEYQRDAIHVVTKYRAETFSIYKDLKIYRIYNGSLKIYNFNKDKVQKVLRYFINEILREKLLTC